MAKRPDKIADGELEKLLSRVDKLPVLDSRSPEKIIGYDETGIPAAHKREPPASPNDQAPPTEPFDFAAWKKKIMGNPASRAIIEDFLKHRHREWELQMEADLLRRAKARGARARREARRRDAAEK